MSLRTRFIGFVAFASLVIFGLALWILPESKLLFVVVEVLLLLVLLWSVHLYRAFLRPLNLLAAGVETIRDKDFQSKFLPTGQPELDQLIDVYNRMIDQLREERTKQREQHYFLERLIHATPTGVLILDLQDKVGLLNAAAARLLGTQVDELLGRACDDLPGRLGSAMKKMAPGETRIVRLSGLQTYRCRKSHFIDRGFHRHFLMIEELTEEILSSQKGAYTSVIRMMSHEVNNTVGAVNSILQSCLGFGDQLRREDREEFETAFTVAINRNNGLNAFMSKLASVVRIPAPARENHDLHEILKAVQVLISSECRKRDINLSLELVPGPLVLRLDADQMEQVLINILRNAMEAIGNGGNITVRTSTDPARLVIGDDGDGIEPGVREQLFSPFFSTKRNGQGVGLTLIKEILANHGCRFNLEDNGKRGALFWIDFEPTRSGSSPT